MRGDPHNGTHAKASETDALKALLSRLLATHGPMTLDQIRARYALPEDTLRDALQQWTAEHHGIQGRLLPGRSDPQYCDRHNLEQAHRRTLVILRGEIQPVSIGDYVDFLAYWQHVHPQHHLASADGLRRALQQLRALPAPALLWQRDLLPARVERFRPADLEALCQSGEVVWVCSGQGAQSHLRARLLFRGEGSCYLPSPPAPEHLAELSQAAQKVLGVLRSEGACFTADLERATSLRGAALVQALLELVAASLVTNDSLRALHEFVHLHPCGETRRPLSSLEAQLAARWDGPRHPRQSSPGRVREARRLISHHLSTAPQWSGRWSLVHRLGIWGQDLSPEERSERQARQLLARYGIVSRDCLAREDRHLAWDALYDHLQLLEMRGEVRRGYFVEGLSGAQFALPEAVERLRERRTATTEAEPPIVLSAWDPALFPAAHLLAGLRLPDGSPLAPPRRLSSYCILQHGRPLLWLERHGRAILAPKGVEEKELLEALRTAFRSISGRTSRRRLTIETWNGAPALGSQAQPLLEAAGCYPHAPVLEWTS